MIGFALCMFSFYSLAPMYFSFYSSAMFNLNLLASEFYVLLLSLVLFKIEV